MSDFIYKQVKTPNIPQERIPLKIRIKKTDVKLDFLLAKEVNGKYKIEYYVSIIPSVRERNPSIPLNIGTINKKDLESAIIYNLDYYDRKYMNLLTFDTKKAIFYLSEKFFIDAFNSITPTTTFSSFRRDFRLKIRLPRVIVYDPVGNFNSFLIKKFIEYMEKKRKEGKWFKYLLPKQLRAKYRKKIRNMFNWNYDPVYNKISATLKTIYILAIIYATGTMLKKIKPSDTITYSNKKLFADKVKGNIKQFDSKKFDKYIKRRGFV
jgi:hypothetical protein